MEQIKILEFAYFWTQKWPKLIIIRSFTIFRVKRRNHVQATQTQLPSNGPGLKQTAVQVKLVGDQPKRQLRAYLPKRKNLTVAHFSDSHTRWAKRSVPYPNNFKFWGKFSPRPNFSILCSPLASLGKIPLLKKTSPIQSGFLSFCIWTNARLELKGELIKELRTWTVNGRLPVT